MRNFAPILAVAIGLTTVPAFAGSPAVTDAKVQLAQLDICVGPDCRDRDRDWRYRHRGYGWDRDRWDRSCRDITVRERNEYGEMIVKHIRRCD